MLRSAILVCLAAAICTNQQMVVASQTPEYVVTTILLEGFATQDINGRWIGFFPDLITELAGRLGFRPDIRRVPDGRYGSYNNSTRSWDGLIGEVYDKRADFAAAPLTVTAYREESVDFSHGVLNFGLVVVARPAKWINVAVRRGPAFFLAVFDVWVWLACGGLMLLTSLLLYCNSRCNPRELEDLYLFGAVCATVRCQGTASQPRSLAGRCLSTAWWLFAAITAVAYAGGFLCTLVASEGSRSRHMYAPMINIRDRFSADPDYLKDFTPVWIKGGSTDHFFATAKEALFQQFNRKHQAALRKRPELQVYSTKELIGLVLADTQVLAVMEAPMADFFVKKTDCEVIVLGDLTNDKSYGLAFAQNSSLLGRFNLELLRLQEDGRVLDIYRRYFGSPGSLCGTKLEASTRSQISEVGDILARMFRGSIPLTLKSFVGPIGFYFAGVGLSLIAFLVDLIIHHGYERTQSSSADQPKPPSEGAAGVALTTAVPIAED
uniref:PBPe domain-containing protein n=1 Tax=Macrostomum lignano TaxID=282301 RepID=A0A1I8J329_9PLAT